MTQFLVQFAASYILTRLSQKNGPRLKDLKGFTADYGALIPLVLGPENRTTDNTVIWATKIKETKHKHKPAADYFFGIIGALLPSQKSYTYSIDFAVLLCSNPIRRVVRIMANKKVIFDAGASTALVFTKTDGTHSLFDTLRVYQGSYTQLPDPTIEADKGMGNVPAYLGMSYIVIDELQLESFNNAVPQELEVFVEEAETGDLRRIVAVMCAAAGLDLNSVSTTSLRQNVRGFIVADSVAVSDAFDPLRQAYSFDTADVNGGLRFVPRGYGPRTTISAGQLGGQAWGEDAPEPIRWIRQPETSLPAKVTFSFSDPARDLQPNSMEAIRSGGSAQSNIVVNSTLVMTETDGQRVANEILWTAWSERAEATTTLDDSRADVAATDVHAIQTPTGMESFRIIRRARGVNGVIEITMAADRPTLYTSDLPGVPSSIVIPGVELAGPVNPPIIFEPPSSLSSTAQVWIAVSGGSSGVAAANWPGVNVFVATVDSTANYRTAGAIDTGAYQGVLADDLPTYVGANPDTGNTMSVDLLESDGILTSVAPADAATGVINLGYIGGASPEFLTWETAAAVGQNAYDATGLYRSLFGTVAAHHVQGAPFCVVDDAIFRYTLPADLIGVPLYFKFLQPGQSLADVPSYLYTPAGTGFGGGAGGVPETLAAPTVTPDIGQILVKWAAAKSTDNVTDYDVYRAPGLGASFGSATKIASVGQALVYADTALAPGTDFTYFVVPVNVVGAASASPGGDTTTSSTDLTKPIVPLIAAASDETTPIIVASDLLTVRTPYAFTVTGVRASLTTPQTSGSTFTVDIKVGGVSILSTLITIDNGELSSVGAAVQPVLSTTSLADDAEITVDVTQIGDGTATGLKVYVIGHRT